jgi:hypothetical protein
VKIGTDDYDTRVEQSERWTGGVVTRLRSGWRGAGVRKRQAVFAQAPDPKGGELYVYPYSERDEMFGRRRFFLYWRGYLHSGPDGHSAPCWGLRGQAYHADDRQYIRRHIEAGGRAFWWPTGDEIALEELGQPAAR